jgi:hypothetical protein
LPRQLLAIFHAGSKSNTFGAASRKDDYRPTHVDGIADTFAIACLSARGTDDPMQPMRESAPGRPVFTSADESRFAGVNPRNSPMPPRRTPGVVLVNRPSPFSMFAFRTCPVRL